jgi:carotenoid cleavage dioxygenase-like enzyme
VTKPFPQTMDFAGFNAPSRIECEVFDLVIEGELPQEINGNWYRSIPDPQYPPKPGWDTYLSGDGMVSLFRIENGHADFSQRYVMTERLKRDRAARRSLHGLYRNPYTDDPGFFDESRTTSNTTPVFHAGKLLATKEDERPYAMDPHTLQTLGQYDFGGVLKSKTMTAHVRPDPETGELFFFGYEAGGLCSKEVAFCVADKTGKLVHEEWFEAPFVSWIHDFCVTKDHILFPLQPASADLERLKAGGQHWLWEPERGTLVGIMPRGGSVKELRWFKGPAQCFFHFLNAYSEGDKVHMDVCASDTIVFPFVQEASGLVIKPEDMGKGGLERWTFDLSRNEDGWEVTPLGPPGDMPRIADKDAMRDYEIGYYETYDPAAGPPNISGPVGAGFNTILRINVKTREIRAFAPGPRITVQEHIHIPSRQSGHEGWLAFVCDLHDENLSDVFVLEAEHPERGPIARIKLPLRLRPQVHGTWVPRDQLPPE